MLCCLFLGAAKAEPRTIEGYNKSMTRYTRLGDNRNREVTAKN